MLNIQQIPRIHSHSNDLEAPKKIQTNKQINVIRKRKSERNVWGSLGASEENMSNMRQYFNFNSADEKKG